MKTPISQTRTNNAMPKRKKDKQYIENKRSSNTDLTKNRGWTQMLRKVKQILLHMWHPSCYSCHKPGDLSWEMATIVMKTSEAWPWSFVTQIFPSLLTQALNYFSFFTFLFIMGVWQAVNIVLLAITIITKIINNQPNLTHLWYPLLKPLIMNKKVKNEK